MTDMGLAAARVAYAMEKGEKIAVFGDYDVDGICSSYILTKGLQILGAKVDTTYHFSICTSHSIR